MGSMTNTQHKAALRAAKQAAKEGPSENKAASEAAVRMFRLRARIERLEQLIARGKRDKTPTEHLEREVKDRQVDLAYFAKRAATA